MPSNADEQAGRRTSSRGVSPILVVIIAGGVGFWFLSDRAENFPLLDTIGRLYWLSLFVGTFVVVSAAVLWLRRKKLSSAAEPAVEWVVSIVAALFFGIVAALVSTIWMFPVVNGALDYGPVTQRSYTVAEFVAEERDASGACPGSRTLLSGDDSRYFLQPRGAGGGGGRITIGVGCNDERGLPTDGGEVVPVGGEVLVDVKPGLFGKPWLAGVQAAGDE